MRSALSQALDIVGPGADGERTLFLACIIADLMSARFRADRETPDWRAAWAAADGRERVRMALAAAEPCFLVDWTEPKAALQRLGFRPPARPAGAADD